ncbi:MAG: acyl-CoA thioesterase [Candidatus Omnitrophica bacterium]|nr:acyl-CoA thioesterase [Candidatus Omnitrophota bacterium]
MQKRIYYHDTDAGGVVYYANYLKFFEEARTEFFAQKGFSIRDLASAGTMFVVARQEVDYKFPAVYGDELDIETCVASSTGVRIEFSHQAKNQHGQLICKGKATLVCVDKTFKPKALPEAILTVFL